MKKSIWIFLLAVLLPSGVLGWLALRSAEEQQIILEKRTAELYQAQTENAAGAARALIDDERRAFNETVRRLLATKSPQEAANNFTTDLTKEWPRKAIGFALGKEGQICAPPPQRAAANKAWGKFLIDNGAWMAGTTAATVYWVAPEDLSRPEQLRKGKGDYNYDGQNSGNNTFASKTGGYALNRAGQMDRRAQSQAARMANPSAAAQQPAVPAPAAPLADAPGNQAAQVAQINTAPLELANNAKEQQSEPRGTLNLPNLAGEIVGGIADVLQAKDSAQGKNPLQESSPPNEPQQKSPPNEREKAADLKRENAPRNVEPQQVFASSTGSAVLSQLTPTISDFRALTTDASEGVITRFVQDQLNIIFWLRPAQAPDMIFGCMIEAANLSDLWPAALPAPDHGSREKWSRTAQPEFVLALLDDKARPIATQPPGETARNWKRPFVASEIGEALPHWEAALYLQNPGQVRESARALRRTLVFLIAVALGAIACGGWLVVADARRQLALAQQKTDFVSNVSHELKTPLTSIRMFAELMQNGRGDTVAKHPQYLRIIMVEAERLTRLINNVLDFAGLERKQKRFEKKPLDLHAVIARTWEGHELHLRESGFTTRWEAAPPPYPVVGDNDALAQILVNLLSNAEKYSCERKEVELHTYLDGPHVCVSVLDRGCGVHNGEERKIFEAFYRAHDSLSSGIQGSGLGLTLAQRLAHEHGGEITYQPRAGGGSNFTLRLPLADFESTKGTK